MTTAPAADTAARTPAGHPPPGFGAALRSEWRKFRALPSNRAIIGAALALTVGITVVMTVFGDTAAMAREQNDGRYAVIFFGATLGVWAFSALAANVVAAEYRQGTIAMTFTATPRRWRPVTAKLVVIAAAAFVAGHVVSLVNFAITQAALGAAGESTVSLSDPGMLRAALVYIPLSMVVQSLLTACAAVVLRTAPGAFAFVVLLGALPVVGAQFLGRWWGETIPRHMAGAAAESVAGIAVPGTPGYLPTMAAGLVIVVWLAVFVAIALTVSARRDA
ncbi:ABC-2 type transport system permease protein [Murinocardiopsis flavida]|uniref:ABC-2 type transport system permease protein n=1 Tax=Murinocardiopsis flavida TaxID=645275 RepID=A0A2P8DRR4_9ACTN|nr:hypothetical protein [Murinocardiopsis flavida]PSK99905.1 ABC-2 type transport system permease protein [Murinocardiopsis flavida]